MQIYIYAQVNIFFLVCQQDTVPIKGLDTIQIHLNEKVCPQSLTGTICVGLKQIDLVYKMSHHFSCLIVLFCHDSCRKKYHGNSTIAGFNLTILVRRWRDRNCFCYTHLALIM